MIGSETARAIRQICNAHGAAEMVESIAASFAPFGVKGDQARAMAIAAVLEFRAATPGMLAAGTDEVDFQHFAGRSTEVAVAAAFDRMCGEALCDAQLRSGVAASTTDAVDTATRP